MDRNRPKSDRPALFKVDESVGAENASAPILIDARDRERSLASTSTSPRTSSYAVWLVLGIAGLVTVGAALMWFSPEPAATPESVVSVLPPPTAEAPATARLLGGADSTAATAETVTDPLTAIRKPGDPIDALGASPAAVAVSAVLLPAATAAPSADPVSRLGSASRAEPVTTRPKTESARIGPVASTRAKSEKLLPELMNNIRNRPPESAPKAQTMDALIEELRRQDSTSPDKKADKTKSHQAAYSEPSANLQTRMRNCPPANTADGIRCRQRLCTRHGGGDPACPQFKPTTN